MRTLENFVAAGGMDTGVGTAHRSPESFLAAVLAVAAKGEPSMPLLVLRGRPAWAVTVRNNLAALADR
jgi:hypothetical protein